MSEDTVPSGRTYLIPTGSGGQGGSPRRRYFIDGQAPGSIHPRNLVLELVLSLHPYVTEADFALERKDFLRTVATRILDDIGT